MGRLGSILGAWWVVLGVSWVLVGAVLGRLGAPIGQPKKLVKPLKNQHFAVLGCLRRLGVFLGVLGRLRPSSGRLACVLGRLVGVLGACWGSLGPSRAAL